MRQHLALHEKTKGARSDASGKGKKNARAKIESPVQAAATAAARRTEELAVALGKML
jgi:hypothetical protein